MKNTLNQNVNAYRAKLLRPQSIESENSSEVPLNKNKSTIEDLGGEVLEPDSESKEVQKDSPICVDDDVEVEVQDEIVEYRGMKMTLSQREEYIEMEEE